MSMVGAVVDVCASMACNDSGVNVVNGGNEGGGVSGAEEKTTKNIEATTTQCVFVANIPNQLHLHDVEKCLNELFKDSGEIVFIKASMDKLGRPYGFIYFKEEIPFAPLLENEFKMCGRRLRIEKAKGSAATVEPPTFHFNPTTTTTTTPNNIPLFPCYLVNVDIERWTPCRLLKLFSFYGDIQFLEGPKRFGPNPLDTLAIIYYTSQEEALQAAESINGSLMDTTTVHSSTNVVSLTANEFYYNNDDDVTQ